MHRVSDCLCGTVWDLQWLPLRAGERRYSDRSAIVPPRKALQDPSRWRWAHTHTHTRARARTKTRTRALLCAGATGKGAAQSSGLPPDTDLLSVIGPCGPNYDVYRMVTHDQAMGVYLFGELLWSGVKADQEFGKRLFDALRGIGMQDVDVRCAPPPRRRVPPPGAAPPVPGPEGMAGAQAVRLVFRTATQTPHPDPTAKHRAACARDSSRPPRPWRCARPGATHLPLRARRPQRCVAHAQTRVALRTHRGRRGLTGHATHGEPSPR